MIRVALLSFWHVHAKDYARQAQLHPDTEIVAAWDEDAARGRAQAEAYGARFYERLDDVLAQAEIDGVIVDTPTNMHREVMVAAAQAGKHIFTEKVLALTVQECRDILAAVERSDVVLTVSLPRLNEGYTLAVKEIVDRQLLGGLTLVRTRLSHNGAIRTQDDPNGWLPPYFFDPELCGGGALIDLGCHPMYLARLFLGLPERVSANFGYVTGRAVEDNAVVVLHYPGGGLGVVEAGFVNRFSPFTIEAHGTEGSLLYSSRDGVLRARSTLLDTSGSGGTDDWRAVSQPPALPSSFEQWVGHIQHGTKATDNIAMAVDLTTLMEAAIRSAREQRPVHLDEVLG
ncbi:MAG TPA: Gfo/Idh/MocA family oxidoreductase [Ktedonobacterales bacterium]